MLNDNLKVNDFGRICRTCLAEGEMNFLYERGSEKVCLIEMLTSITLLQLSEKDGLPVQICLNCEAELKRAYRFIHKCLEVDKKLRKCFEEYENHVLSSQGESLNSNTTVEKQIPEIELVEIKTEIDIDEHEVDIHPDYVTGGISTFHNDSESDSGNDTPPEIKVETQNVQGQTLPEKSKEIYLKVYTSFKQWCLTKNVTDITENMLLVYFHEQAINKKPSSLWAIYSMLKATLLLKDNKDISKYFKLLAFLKHENSSYKPKKSSVFTREEITKFLNEAPDESFLSTKAIFVIGLAGACRTDELCNMQIKDIDIRDDIIIINIPKSRSGSSRKFVLVEPSWIDVVKKYLSKRPSPDMLKVFIGFRHGKPTRQNIGHNTISKVPKTVAVFLKLPNSQNYTGHSLRRTSATILAENGGGVLSLKRHGWWRGYKDIGDDDAVPSTSSCSGST